MRRPLLIRLAIAATALGLSVGFVALAQVDAPTVRTTARTDLGSRGASSGRSEPASSAAGSGDDEHAQAEEAPSTTSTGRAQRRAGRAPSDAPAGSITPDTLAPTASPTAPVPALRELVAPPAPDDRHIVVWGRVLDEDGHPVVGACLHVSSAFDFHNALASISVRSRSDGSYVLEVPLLHPDQDELLYGVGPRSCAGEDLKLLLGGATPSVESSRRAGGGTTQRVDFTMLHAATSVDVAFVDPVGRPVTGICARVFLNLSGQTDSQPVGADGHLRVGRPESLSLFVVVDGVCGAHVEHWSASRHTFDLHRGANQVTFVVPWSAGDVVTEPVLMHGTEATYDLLAVSTQPNELDPSCIGSFGASRWFSMSSYPNGVDWGPVNGGVIKTTLSQGGTVAIWGYDGSRVVEIGCARAGQAVVVPPDLYPQIAVQVIPDPGPAQTGRTWYEA